MGRIVVTSLELITILFLRSDISQVECATVSAANKNAVLGSNVVSVNCNYSLEQGENFLSMRMLLQQSSGAYQELALFQGGQAIYSISDKAFVDRTNLTFTEGHTGITFKDVECADNRKYQCQLTYSRSSSSFISKATMNLIVQSKPRQPEFFPANFATSSVKVEHKVLQVECRGRVGKPAGNYIWFGYLKSGGAIDLTSHADPGIPYGQVETDCFYQRISTLKYNLTRNDNGMVIRCTTNQSLLGPLPTSSSACGTSSCRQSDPVVVEYPVSDSYLSISRLPTYSEYIIGSEVTLTCNIDSNPDPTFLWRKEGEENITMSGKEWKLENLQLDDSGTYTCEVSNTVQNVVYNASKSLNIRVVAMTTSPPTTAPATKDPSHTTDDSSHTTDDTSQSTTETGSVKPTPGQGSQFGIPVYALVISILLAVILTVVVVVGLLLAGGTKLKLPGRGNPCCQKDNTYASTEDSPGNDAYYSTITPTSKSPVYVNTPQGEGYVSYNGTGDKLYPQTTGSHVTDAANQ